MFKKSDKKKLISVLKSNLIDLNVLIDELIKTKKIIIICGPTGIGKSKLGIEIASLFNTNLISADSMQIYQGMDIGTDKVNTAIYGIRQYMIDLFKPDHKLTVIEFRDIAIKIIIDQFFKKNRVPVIVGGSGLYVKAIIDDMDRGPGEDSRFREEMEKNIDMFGLDKYYKRLCRIDKTYASKISRNDKRRIIRALEVYDVSGIPYSRMQKSWKKETLFDVTFIGLKKERAALYGDIEKRVDEMFASGLVEEVRGLLNGGYMDSFSLKQAVGYKEVVEHIKGEISLDECRSLVKQNSRRLAKKQMTWFGRDTRINWLPVDNYDNIFDLVIDTVKVIHREFKHGKN